MGGDRERNRGRISHIDPSEVGGGFLFDPKKKLLRNFQIQSRQKFIYETVRILSFASGCMSEIEGKNAFLLGKEI